MLFFFEVFGRHPQRTIIGDGSRHVSQVYGFYIAFTVFSGLSALGSSSDSSGRGGSIHLSGSVQDVLIVSCLFNNCQAKACGGAIHFYPSIGNFYMIGCCTNRCFCYGSEASEGGQNSYIVAGLNKTISIQYSSFQFSNPASSDSVTRWFSSILNYGFQTINGMNSTKNSIYHTGSTAFNIPSGLNVLYTSICNNFASNTKIIQIIGGSDSRMIKNSNIISNDENCHATIVLWSAPIVTIENSILLKNTRSLFYLDQGQLTLKDCYIYHTGTLSNLGIQTPGSVFGSTSTNSLALSHVSTAYCGADIPLSFDINKYVYSYTIKKTYFYQILSYIAMMIYA